MDALKSEVRTDGGPQGHATLLDALRETALSGRPLVRDMSEYRYAAKGSWYRKAKAEGYRHHVQVLREDPTCFTASWSKERS